MARSAAHRLDPLSRVFSDAHELLRHRASVRSAERHAPRSRIVLRDSAQNSRLEDPAALATPDGEDPQVHLAERFLPSTASSLELQRPGDRCSFIAAAALRWAATANVTRFLAAWLCLPLDLARQDSARDEPAATTAKRLI